MFTVHKCLSHRTGQRQRGFTLIELMVVVAIVAILFAIALPVYSNYTIRTKLTEGLSVAMATKTAVASTCIENPTIAVLNNTAAGFTFTAGTDIDDYVADIQTSGACTTPLITITSKNTGQSPDPVLMLQGQLIVGEAKFEWRCSSNNTPNFLLPGTCRSS